MAWWSQETVQLAWLDDDDDDITSISLSPFISSFMDKWVEFQSDYFKEE